MFSLKVPNDLSSDSSYFIQVVGSGGLVFDKTAEMKLSTDLMVLIQTDKPRYEATQEGNFHSHYFL